MSLTSRKSTRSYRATSSTTLQSSKQTTLPKDYGGLGKLYFDRLSENTEKILQVDLIHSVTESRGSVRGRAIMLAQYMKKLGLSNNDIVAIYTNLCAEQAVILLATMFIGAILAPLDSTMCQAECKRIIKKLKPKIIFIENRTSSLIELVLGDLRHKAILIDLNNNKRQNIVPFNGMLLYKENSAFIPTLIEDPIRHLALILPTQGTTGDIKLVGWTHQNVIVQTTTFNQIFNNPDNPDKMLTYFPISFYLQIIIIFFAFDRVMTLILPESFSPKTACKYIQDFNITNIILATEYVVNLMSSVFIKDYNVSSLKTILIGTTSIARSAVLKFGTICPDVKLLVCYGLTETGIIANTNASNYEAWLEKRDSVGTLTVNSKVRIVDPESRLPLYAGKTGEICFKGDGLMFGYFKDPERTAASIEKGYFKTGDLGTYDEDGWLQFVGRMEDKLNYNSLDIMPSFLEDVVVTHPKISSVAIIGTSNEMLLIYVEAPGKELQEKTVRDFLKDKFESRYMPTKIIKMSELPTTSVGNVKKQELRERFLKSKLTYVDSLASLR